MRRRSRGVRVGLLTLLLLSGTFAWASDGAAASSGSPPGQGGTGTNGTLSLTVTPSSANLKLNGSPVPLPASGIATLSLAPGTYPVTATAPGHVPFEGNVTILTGQTAYLTIQLVGTPGDSGSGSITHGIPLTVLATVAGAVVLVGLAVLLLRPGRSRTPNGEPDPSVRPPSPEQDEGPV